METARDSIRVTLNEIKAFLAQEAPPSLSEADTKAYFIEPVIEALGWEGLGVVTREYYVRNSQEFIDYVLRGPSGLLMAIETKKISVDLADKHAAQLVQYCAVDGIEWAALTNGRELQFFNAFLRGDLAAKRVVRIDLLAFNSDEEFESIFNQLWQLSRERMTAPSSIRSWMHQRRMDTTLRQVLANPGSQVMLHLQGLLADREIAATPQDLVGWFRANLAGSSRIVALPPPRETPTSLQTLPSPVALSPTKSGASVARKDEHGRLWPLLEKGLLQPGARLQLLRGKNIVAEATIDDSGMIVFEGLTYRSPSDRAFSRLLGRQSLNGWREWRVDAPGGRVSLDEFRQRLGPQANTNDEKVS